MDVEITRVRIVTLVTAVIAILVVAAEGQVLIKPLTPVALYGDSVGLMKSPIMETTAMTINTVAITTYALFFGPGPPMSLRSVRNATIRGCGAGRKTLAFLLKATTYRAKLMKMRVRMYSRFYIT